MAVNNPILQSDFPDVDVIRVDDTYYMISTTMHFMPGAVILRSFDLVHWEIFTHVFETLDDTPAQRMEGGQSIYGQGMWAASLRHHGGTFYVCFVANDTRKTYLYQAQDIRGPWRRQIVEGFYHDCSLLFDDDGHTYIVYGNTEIFITELRGDLSGPQEGGLHRVIIRDQPGVALGYEGAHIYKIDGRYYVFLIHWLADGTRRRTQACFAADALGGEFSGGDILDDDMGYHNMGVAQGGVVDTPDGDWYAVLFQDQGAVGRVPVLVPMRWENRFPVLGVGGRVPAYVETKSTRPNHIYAPFVSSDDFRYQPNDDGTITLSSVWQWNHAPDNALWSVDGARGALTITTARLSENVTRAANVLTQRAIWPGCSASVQVDASALREGDYAGLCALQGRYGMVAITKENGQLFAVMQGRPGEADYTMGQTCDTEAGVEHGRVALGEREATLMARLHFRDMEDYAEFFYLQGGEWRQIGAAQGLYFGLDHFVGCRFGLFIYATQESGGSASFREFVYAREG
ncbi:glycosyl hydrolase 43 family protein [Chloroflexia bacterium SDU3-3]|nr:glycosyl hydrolase 43 family protein [Chloroflexia bacterium SDU3-3]